MGQAPRPRAWAAGPGERLLVDGTNVAWAWRPVRDLLVARAFGAAQRYLVERLAAVPALAPAGCTIVFDGPPPAGGPSSRAGVQVRYPEPGQSGDDRLLELILATAHGPFGVRLVTSDRALKDAARQLGAATASGGSLLDRLDPGWRAPGRPAAPDAPGSGKPRPSRGDTERWLAAFRGAPGAD